MRMKTFLKDRPQSKTDWAWVKDCWRPIKSYRIVTRGKRKGDYEVTLFYPEGRKRIVPAGHTRFIDRD